MSTSSSPASEAGSTLVVKKGHTTATCETPSATRSDSPKSETSDISSDKSKKVKLEPEVVETIDSVATTDCATSESSTKERELNAPVLAIDDKLEICSTIPVIEFSSPIATSSYDTSPQALCTSDVVVSQDEDKSMCANLSKLISANNQQPSLANILVTSNKVPSSSANKIFLTDHTLIKTSNFPNGCSTTTSAITTSSTSTKPLVINHLSSLTNVDKVVKHPSETQSIIPTLSSQLIFSSIITTKPAPSQNPATQISRTLTVPAKTSNPSSAKTTATLVVANGKNSATTTPTSHGSRGNKSSHNKQNGTNLTMSNTNVSNVGQVAAARLIDMGKRLLDAARDGHTEHVRQLVVNSGAPFTSDWLGTTALHLAAQFGHTEIADILLKGGVNRDAKTKLDRTALHLASQNGWLGVVDLLLIHGSDVNARDMLKMTPLHWAVQRCHASVAERLLLSGADVSAKSKFDLTPIDLAQTSDCYEIIELFKSWTNCSDITFDNHHHQPVAVDKSGDLSTLNYNFNESHDMLDVDYHLTLDVDHHHTAAPGRTHTLDIDEPGIDLELEWNTLKFEPDFFLTNNDDDEGDEGEDDDDDGEPKVEYLKKIVEELTKENRQLRQRVEQLSTTSKCQ